MKKGMIPLLRAYLILIGGLLISGACRKDLDLQEVDIIPEPAEVNIQSLSPFVVKDHSLIYITDSSMYFVAELLQASLPPGYIIERIDSSLLLSSGILLRYDTGSGLPASGYELSIHTHSIRIDARDAGGLLYGVQTLRQMLPPDPKSVRNASLPSVVIRDYPRFGWRGMHLDVSRHFMPVSFVKKYIDMLAYHKLNVFHWHLVDGIGWRIEIKSHPELTDIGAWRVMKEGKKPWEDFEVWREGDLRPKYGGYYTQEEVKEVVAYAAQRNITVLPEIELPGHSEVVFQCYPGLQCIDDDRDYLPNIGVYCANLPASYDLLEDILKEVMDLFPSEYIHIGGDEVNKSNWMKCVRDRELMQKNNFTPEEVQSYFVNHFDQFLRSHGRKLMGWHEILEGELSPNAAIMYWGGEGGVKDMLEQGHEAVLTPGNRYYFDHYQSTSIHEPEAFGGLSTLTQVYQYEPFPESLEDVYADRMLGIQANVWTEYMEDTSQVEYMAFPRMAALAESAWSPREKKDWSRFSEKIPKLISLYASRSIHYANSAYRPMIQVEAEKGRSGLDVRIEPELNSAIFYTTDGEQPTPEEGIRYHGSFHVDTTTTVKAGAYIHDTALVLPEMKKVIVHQALGAEVTLDQKGPFRQYSAEGGQTLVDGQFGGNNWGNGKWLGYLSRDFRATIRMKKEHTIHSVGYSAIEDQPSGIYFPDAVEVAVSGDGHTYQEVARLEIDHAAIHYDTKTKDSIFYLNFPPVRATAVKVTAQYPRIPGEGVFLFIDEIIVE